jgi:hypothetical protein
MRRLVVVHCIDGCERDREVICDEDEVVRCPCGSLCEQQWWRRSIQRETVWHKDEMAVVFKKPDGTFSFPAVNTKPTPEGCERIEIRSDAQMAKIEREAGVRSERRWFDRGSGNGHDGDETMRPAPRPTDPELLKYLGRRAN